MNKQLKNQCLQAFLLAVLILGRCAQFLGAAKARSALIRVLLLAFAFAGVWSARANIVITGASGGTGISADTSSTGVYTTLGTITIAEGNKGDFQTAINQTMTLKVPAGFQFNTAQVPSITFTPSRNIFSASAAFSDSSTLVITFTDVGGSLTDTIFIGGTTNLQVRPTTGTPLATGKHIYCSAQSQTTAGLVTSTDGSSGSNFGNLAEVAGALAGYAVTGSTAQNAGVAFTVTNAAQDQFGNAVTNDNSTVVTLTSSTGNVQFDGNNDGVYGDDTKTLTAGTFTITAKDNTAETVNIIATDASANSGTLSNVVVNANPLTGAYRSHQTGTWASTSTWERWSGSAWVTPAPSVPIASNSVIEIRNGHTVTVGAAAAADQIVVDAGGTLTINSTLTLSNGVGADLDIFGTVNGASVQAISATNTAIVVESGGVLNATSSGADLAVSGTVTVAGGTVTTPSGKGITGVGTFSISGGTVTVGTAATGGADFTMTGMLTMSGGTLKIGHDFKPAPANFSATGGTVEFLGTSGPGAFSIAGTYQFFNILVDSGVNPSFAGAANTFNIKGSLTNNGSATFVGTTVNFSGTGPQFIAGATTTPFDNVTVANTNAAVSVRANITVAAVKKFTVNSGADLEMGTNVMSGAGTNIVSSGATLGIGSPAGITTSGATGNIQTTGRIYSSGASYVYNGSAAQVTGTGLPTPVNSVTVTNGANATLSQAATITNLTLGAGNFTNTTLTMANGGTITRYTGSLTTTPTFTTSVNVIYSGVTGVTSGNELPTNTTVLNNLTLNYSATATATLNAARTVNGVLTIGANSTLADGGNRLTVKGNVSNAGVHSGAGEILLAGSSSQTLAGTGSYSNLELTNSSGVVLGASLTVNGLLNIDSASSLNLAFPGTATNLTIAGVSKASGTWGSTSSSAGHTDNTHFSGTSVLTVTSGNSSSTSISSSVNPSKFGQSVTFTATVTGTGSPTGTVQFKTNGVNFGSAATLSGGTANSGALPAASPAGTYAVTAVYSGDATFNASTSGTLTQTINKASTASAVATSANPSPTGSNVTFTATVTAVAPGSGTPTGTVQFLADGSALGSPATLSGGIASVTSASLTHGTHTIAAQYAGDGNFLGITNSLGTNQVINTQPIAATDTLQRYKFSGVKVRSAMLLTNDNDPDGDALTFVSFSPTSAAGGAVSSHGNWITYTPPAGFTNADSFTYIIADSGGLQATGTVSVAILADSAPAQNISSIVNPGNGSAVIHFNDIPGRPYTVQYTTNLVTLNWLSLGAATADVLGKIDFTDPSGGSSPPRFYRSTYP